MEKVKLPIKTKIAVLLMVIIGVFFTLVSMNCAGGDAWYYMPSLSVPYFLFAFFLVRKRKWAWYGSVVIIVLWSLGYIYVPLFHLYIPYGIGPRFEDILINLINFTPLALLFWDRKNFWKVCS
jgi:hypothetical protein